MKLPTVIQLNAIQTMWMALQSDDPDPRKKQVIKAMEGYPKTYVSGHDGLGVCIVDGMPLSTPIPFCDALNRCAELGGRTDVAWNGSKGEWYSLY